MCENEAVIQQQDSLVGGVANFYFIPWWYVVANW